MAVIKRIASKATPSKIYNYLTKEEKTEEKLISGMNCNPNTMVNEFNATKELYNKHGDIKYHHVIQSFDPKDNITPEKAHELGKELAEKQFKDYEVLIVTHKDKEHIHNHFVINSVSYESGLKYNSSNKTLWDIKRESNRICERENLKTIDLNKKSKERLTSGELRKELRGETTWKGELKKYIEFAKSKTKTLDDFVKYLKQNFRIDTRVTKNSISYKHPDKTKPIRGSKLGTDYDKEELINGFTRREKSIDAEGDKSREQWSNNFRTRIDGGSGKRNQELDSGIREISTGGDRHTEGSPIKFGGYDKDIQRETGEGQRDNDKQVQRDDRVNKQVNSNDSGQLLEETAGRVKESTRNNEIKSSRNDTRNESNDRKVSSEDRTSIFTKNSNSIFSSRFNSSLSADIQDSDKLSKELLKQIDERKNEVDKNSKLDEEKIEKIKYEDKER